MRALRTPLLLLGLAALTGCHSYRVKYDYDPRAAFSDWKTYAWKAPDPDRKHEREEVDPIMEGRVRAAVEKSLAARGFNPVEGPADFIIHCSTLYRGRTVATTTYGGWGWHPYRLGTASTQVHTYREGTLVLEIRDGKTKNLVWHGAAVGALTGLDTPQEAEEVVGRAVEDVLRDFPPKR